MLCCAEVAAPRRAKRVAISKADRESAALIHRSSVLCLIGHTLLLDQAASNPWVQVNRKKNAVSHDPAQFRPA